MKSKIFLVFCLISTLCLNAQDASNYILVINNDSINIDLDKSIDFKVDKNNTLKIKLVQPNILTYSDDKITFKYNKTIGISNTDLGDGIEQLMGMKPTGTGFMVQKYSTMNPEMLIDLMLNEVIKESMNYGYTKQEEKFSKELISGQIIKGKKAILDYKGEKETYLVASYGKKDEGLLILTMIANDDYLDEDQKMLDLFWNTLKIND